MIGKPGTSRYHFPEMSTQVEIEKLPFFSDGRGWVIEPVGETLLASQRNVHVVFSKPGAVRGNHYHERSTEVFVVMGPCLVRLAGIGGPQDIRVPEGEAMRFTVPPGLAHAIQNTGSRPMVLISFSTEPHDRARPDTIPAVLIEK